MPKASNEERTGPSSGSVMSFMAELTKGLSPALSGATSEEVHKLKDSIHLIREFVSNLLNDIHSLSDEEIQERSALPLKALKLSTRAYHATHNAGIETIGQLARFDPDDLKRFRGLGRLSFLEIRAKLKAMGLSLGSLTPAGVKEKNTLRSLYLKRTIFPFFTDSTVGNHFSRIGIRTVSEFLEASQELVISAAGREVYASIREEIDSDLNRIDSM